MVSPSAFSCEEPRSFQVGRNWLRSSPISGQQWGTRSIDPTFFSASVVCFSCLLCCCLDPSWISHAELFVWCMGLWVWGCQQISSQIASEYCLFLLLSVTSAEGAQDGQMNGFMCAGSCPSREMSLEASLGEGVCVISVSLKMKESALKNTDVCRTSLLLKGLQCSNDRNQSGVFFQRHTLGY